MVGVRGVRWRAASEVLRDRPVCASLTVVGDVAKSPAALKARRGVPCSARLMVVGRDAYSQAARRALRGVRLSAKGTVVESAAYSMEEGSARRVCTEGQVSALHMAGGRGALFPDALKAPVAGLIVA